MRRAPPVAPHPRAVLSDMSAGCALRQPIPAGAVADLHPPSQRQPFRLSLPEATLDPRAPPPLVLFFHGLYNDQAMSNGLHAHAHARGYVVAAPREL